MILQCRPKVPLVRLARFIGQQYLKKIEGLPGSPSIFIIQFLYQSDKLQYFRS